MTQNIGEDYIFWKGTAILFAILSVLLFALLFLFGYEKPEFLVVAERVANHRIYNFPEWACNNMSEMLVDELTELGYEANTQEGEWFNDGHVWVILTKIPIEATSGRVIPPAEYKENYEEA